MTFTLKNVSGAELEIRDLRGGTFVAPNALVDIEEKLHDENAEAYITVQTVKNIAGRDSDENGLPGALIWEDEDVYRAWPKAHWSKVTRESNKTSKNDKEEK